jgi:hypothetical protein
MNPKLSLLVSGQILSRFSSAGVNLENVITSLKLFKNMNPKNEIIFSTYKNEIPRELLTYIDKIVINDDPGPDHFRINPWPIGSNSRRHTDNISRLLISTRNGIMACTNRIVIKTRIEILPYHQTEFTDFYKNILRIYTDKNTYKIGFFVEHYTGIFTSLDGQLGMMPAMIQIGPKHILENLWTNSIDFWVKNKQLLTRRTVRHPITSEQVLGLIFLSLYCDFPLITKIKKLRKYYISSTLIKALVRAEKHNFAYLEYKKSGFTNFVYPGTIKVRTPNNKPSNGKFYLAWRVSILLLKRPKHLLRRYYQGIKNKI